MDAKEISPKKVKHIAIAGNIGAGKTTLTTQLGKHFGWEVHYESTEDNPYLSDFYTNMHRWSFNLQIYFLNSRYRQVLEILNGNKTVIHIEKRGRDYEGSISIDYLKRLNERYETWIDGYDKGNLLVINADEIDFFNNKEDLGMVVNLVQGELHGLFQ